ncbi:PA2169 family four-helix-bundle protein [Stieleria sp. ICT_E10.1]|uniref:PA2169 family four-helix-bundle protein n=1 Tax=Stieleria sedimenti TaxID=2976331 RepID=UPI00217F6F4B|nr:PA2169 family four-helix-bundle protein [Stieleria sedimenti]MCS7465490.1 PA2169 family four-helix-bundle protein [Stieleria sedimenti]
MSLETKTKLSDITIAKLQKLIQANLDSYAGFHEAADKLNHAELSAFFRNIGNERAAMASELQQYVEFSGEKTQDDGSVAAKIHRLWMDIRAKLNGGDPQVILNEAERGEDHIKEAYEGVLKETGGGAMNDVLTAQYAKIKAGHDKIRDLRDTCRTN